jgi:drug/metabolite transporter (DMT)-like permease
MADSEVPPTRSAGTAEEPHSPIKGVLWMLLSCALLAGVAALGRYATSTGVPALQVVFLRLFFALIIMLPLFAVRGATLINTDILKIYLFRALFGIMAMISWFSALSYMPIGELTAISFLTPIFATVIAALFFSERVPWQRWASTAIGFAGALIILRPGLIDVGPGVWFALAAALAMGVSMNLIKSLTTSDDPDKTVFLSSCLMMPLALIPALMVWVWPPLDIWPFLVALGPVAMLGHVTLARAFAAADASFVAGIDFARLPFAVVYGWLAFGELIDFWTWMGAGLIFAAGFFCSRLEAGSNAQAVTPR